jgi:hypothetical protein
MNWQDIIKALNNFRGRKFLIVLLVWYGVYLGKIDQYWGELITISYFVIDLIEKYITHKSEEESTKQEGV